MCLFCFVSYFLIGFEIPLAIIIPQVASDGAVLRSEINGAVEMRCFLTGMPELRLGLNDRIQFQASGSMISDVLKCPFLYCYLFYCLMLFSHFDCTALYHLIFLFFFFFFVCVWLFFGPSIFVSFIIVFPLENFFFGSSFYTLQRRQIEQSILKT